MTELINPETRESTIALPVDRRMLGEFISGLLGQPQSLERQFDNAFSVDHAWLIHFFTTILQRIQQQNAPEPLAFEAAIRYQDKVIRTVTSWQAFQHFSETLNIISVGIKIHLAVLIQFPTKKIPERQEIIIYFETRENKQSIMESLLGREPKPGAIYVEIRHTERTWADDILRLIETELKQIQTTEGRLKKYIRNLLFPFFSFAAPLTMLATMLFTEWSKKDGREALKTQVATALNNHKPDIQSLNSKVDLLLKDAIMSVDGKFGEIMLLMYALAIAALIFFIGAFLSRPTPSFVILTSAAAIHKKETLEKLKRKNLMLLFSMIGSIALGVIGNYVYDKIMH